MIFLLILALFIPMFGAPDPHNLLRFAEPLIILAIFEITFEAVLLNIAIKKPSGVVASDMKNVDLAFPGVGNRLEGFDSFELALVGPGVVEGASVNNLYRAQRAQGGAGQPDFAVAADSDRA